MNAAPAYTWNLLANRRDIWMNDRSLLACACRGGRPWFQGLGYVVFIVLQASKIEPAIGRVSCPVHKNCVDFCSCIRNPTLWYLSCLSDAVGCFWCHKAS